METTVVDQMPQKPTFYEHTSSHVLRNEWQTTGTFPFKAKSKTRALLLHIIRFSCFVWLWLFVLLFKMQFYLQLQASLVHKEFGQLLEKLLSNFQIHKRTLLITGSGRGKKTSFHTVPSGCRISPRNQTSTRSHAFSIPQFPTSLIHILLTSSPILQPHATLHFEKSPRALQNKETKEKHSQVQNC